MTAIRINTNDRITGTYIVGANRYDFSGTVETIEANASGYRCDDGHVRVFIALDAATAQREAGECIIMDCREAGNGTLRRSGDMFESCRLRRAN